MTLFTRAALSIYVVCALASSVRAQNTTQQVTVGLVSPLSAGVAGPIAFAKKLGWLKAEGIEVTFIEFNGSATMLPQLASGRITVGWPNPDPLLISNLPGKDPLPVKMFYNNFRKSVWQFAVLDSSPIRALKDLRGKTVGVLSMTSGNIPITRSQLKGLGMTVGSDVDLVAVGAGAPVGVALNSGRIDALNHYAAQILLMQQSGVKLRLLDQDPKYTDLFSNGFAAAAATLEKDPTLLIKFGRAYAKGQIACLANPKACLETYWSEYPDHRPAGQSDGQSLRNGLEQLELVRDTALFFKPGEPRKFGAYDFEICKLFIDVLFDGGQLTSRDIDPSKVFTNELIDRINEFSVEDVKREAERVGAN
jgi:NitT/TauT family transport system substrate-binding protein